MQHESTEVELPYKESPWNAIITLRGSDERKARESRHILQEFGEVEFTRFFNVLVMRVPNIYEFIYRFSNEYLKRPELQEHISRLSPLMRTFHFNSPEEFEMKAKKFVMDWATALSNKTFHVRIHRRGFKGSLKSLEEEQLLDYFVLCTLKERGTPGKITFNDPDYIIEIDSINNLAGLAIWGREDIKAFPFLNLD